MEIIRYRDDEYAGLPGETVDDPMMTPVTLGVLTALLRHRGTDQVTLTSLADGWGMGVTTRAKTLGILIEGGYVALLRTQSARGSWGSKMIVSEVPMPLHEIRAHIDTLLLRGDVIAVQGMNTNRKTIPGLTFRAPKSAA